MSLQEMTMSKRVLKEYVFEQKIRETFVAESEEEARAKLSEWYGSQSAIDFELVNVTTFEEKA